VAATPIARDSVNFRTHDKGGRASTRRRLSPPQRACGQSRRDRS
jgi:hypothetical protein